jgi:hypothetical protein
MNTAKSFTTNNKHYEAMDPPLARTPANLRKRMLHPTTIKPWPNILTQSKIVVCINPNNFINSDIMVKFADEEFLYTFGYKRETFNDFSLSRLFGKSTSRIIVSRLQKCLLIGKATCEYINLYRRNGVGLSCHISMTVLSSQKKVSINRINSNNNSVESETSNNDSDMVKWGVITVRSASVVGNSKHSGIGILGTKRVKQEVFNNLLEDADTAKALK